jgi:anti-sigma28 factor (negative regulator of flagellin synthesis)
LGEYYEEQGVEGGKSENISENNLTNAVNGGIMETEPNIETKAAKSNTKPTAANPKLQDIINEIYKGQGGKGQIGNGSMMDAVRHERKTGKPTKGHFHSKKARTIAEKLKKQIADGKLNEQDKRIARALIDDINKARSGN